MKFPRITCAVWLVVLVSTSSMWAQSAQIDKKPPAATLPATIPIFPLHDAMLFPNASRPLHIFEPRYRAMVADALKGDRIIGMVTLKPGFEADYDGRPPIFPIGCAGVITDVEEFSDGRFNIIVTGLTKFRVTGEDSSRSYRLARVAPVPEVPPAEQATALGEQRRRLEALLSASADRFAIGPIPPELEDEEVIDVLSQHLEIDPAVRQGLLERDGVLARSRVLLELLEKVVKAPR